MASKRRKRQLKARKPFQTIHLRKKEKRWGKRTVVAVEGLTISESTFKASKVRGASFGQENFKDHLPVEQSPTLSELFKRVFGEAYPTQKDRIFINKGLYLYYNIHRTEYRFVKTSDGVLEISIPYASVSNAMMTINRITWAECKPLPITA